MRGSYKSRLASLRLDSSRSQHLVFLAHVWACAPFLALWMRDLHVRTELGPERVGILTPFIAFVIVYLAIRTYAAWWDYEPIRWQYLFSPIDVVLVTVILCLSQRGPASNVSLLFFLPMIQASTSMNVRWAATVGFMVVLGTVASTLCAVDIITEHVPRTAYDLIHADPLNSFFRVFFLVVLSSLMAFQSRIGAGLKERLAVAADRNRIAMDMHDGVQGHLIAVSSQLELIARIAPIDAERAVTLAGDGRESAQQATDELRFLVQRLRSPSLASGFVSALRQYAHNICERHGLALTFASHGDETPLEPDTENAVFRIAQEAMTNIAKHATAQNVSVNVTYNPPRVILEIRDDGKGFVEEPTTGIGLVGMMERAGKASGAAEIHSEVGKGTTVTAHFPTL